MISLCATFLSTKISDGSNEVNVISLRVTQLLPIYTNCQIYVAVFPRVGMVSTMCHTVTDRSSKLVRRLLANSLLGQALTLVLLMVALVPFNRMITMALVQLGIRNNYSNNLSLRNCRGSSDEPRAGWPGEPSHKVTWAVSGKLIWYYQTDRIQSLKSSGLEYLYFLGGTQTAHAWAMNYSSMWTSTHSSTGIEYWSHPSPELPPTLLVGWRVQTGLGRPRWLESLWHIVLGSLPFD